MKKTVKLMAIILSLFGLTQLGFAQEGIITVTGNFTLGSNSTYKVDLKNMTGAGSGHDQIVVSGNVTLDGILEINLDGYSPNDADQFEIMAYGGTLTGTFNSIVGMPSGWMIDYGTLITDKVNIYGPGSVIPIELLDFSVKNTKDHHLISWTTLTEENNDFFLLETSTDSKTFSPLDIIKSQGSSKRLISYSYKNTSPFSGINYYRLKQIDLDGKESISKVINAVFENDTAEFYPNPTKGIIHFSVPVKNVKIYNILGEEVMVAYQIESSLNISNLGEGIYIIDINGSKQRLILKN